MIDDNVPWDELRRRFLANEQDNNQQNIEQPQQQKSQTQQQVPQQEQSWAELREQFLANEKNQKINQSQSPVPNSQEKPVTAPTFLDNLEQAGRGLVNIPFDILQGGADLINAGSNALGTGNVLDPVYRPIDRPKDQYAQLGEDIGGYLLPGGTVAKAAKIAPMASEAVSKVAPMAIGSLSSAGNQDGDFSKNATENLALNSAFMGAPALFRAISGVGKPTANAAIETANDVSKLARSSAGREEIAKQAANISDDISKAADTAGIDLNVLTPGMRSESRGIAEAEGKLASVPGEAADAKLKAYNEIADKYKQAMSELGAGADGLTSSQLSNDIKTRVTSSLDSMRNIEKQAWEDLRSVPEYSHVRARPGNALSMIAAEKAINGAPLSTAMKQLDNAGKQGMTFDGMKSWRSKFADEEQKYYKSGENNAARIAGEARRAITADMEKMAENGGFIDKFNLANDLSKSRISAQKNAQSIFGKDFNSDTLVTKAKSALLNSSKNGLDGKDGFHSLISSLPEEERASTIAGILKDGISQGVRGGKSEDAGINAIGDMLTPQNVAAIAQHSPELGRLADAYGKLARAATRPLRYAEQTGRTTETLKLLNSGLPGIVQKVVDKVTSSPASAVVGALGGGIPGAIAGGAVGVGADAAITKLASQKSGRYAIEKAIEEATKAVRYGATPSTFQAAEKNFRNNKAAMNALSQSLSKDELNTLLRSGAVSYLSGIQSDPDGPLY